MNPTCTRDPAHGRMLTQSRTQYGVVYRCGSCGDTRIVPTPPAPSFNYKTQRGDERAR